VRVPITVHAFGPRAGAPYSGAALVGIGVRWHGQDNLSGEQPNEGYWSGATYAWHRWFSNEQWQVIGNNNNPRDSQVQDMALGQRYILKTRVTSLPSGQSTVSSKYWPAGSPEPSGWNLSVVEDDGNVSGSVALIAHHVDASFGTVMVTPLP